MSCDDRINLQSCDDRSCDKQWSCGNRSCGDLVLWWPHRLLILWRARSCNDCLTSHPSHVRAPVVVSCWTLQWRRCRRDVPSKRNKHRAAGASVGSHHCVRRPSRQYDAPRPPASRSSWSRSSCSALSPLFLSVYMGRSQQPDGNVVDECVSSSYTWMGVPW